MVGEAGVMAMVTPDNGPFPSGSSGIIRGGGSGRDVDD